MAAGTIPDHVGLRDALLARLRLHLGPDHLKLLIAKPDDPPNGLLVTPWISGTVER